MLFELPARPVVDAVPLSRYTILAMLRQRFTFGILMIVVLVGLLVGDAALDGARLTDEWRSWFSPLGLVTTSGVVSTFVMLVLVGFSLVELRQLFDAAGARALSIWPTLVCLTLIAIPFVAGNGPAANSNLNELVDMRWTLVVLAIGFLGTGLLIIRRGTVTGAVAALGATCFTLLYMGILPAFLVRLRVFAPSDGVWLLLYFVATVKICDIGALFTGMAFGKHKLIPWLSPGKTIEGFFGGIAASVLVAVGPAVYATHIAAEPPSWAAVFPSLQVATIFGVLMAVLGQAGDLIESLLKRDADAKDSGSKIPAFGGLLDVLDSLLPTAPVAWWMLVN